MKQSTLTEESDETQDAPRGGPYGLRPRNRLRAPDMSDYHLDLDSVVLLTYEEAISGKDKDKWLKAIEEEITSLNKNETWRYVPKKDAQGRKILKSRWVFKVKEDGRYRSRLVIKGYEQIPGIDFHETYSPVVNIGSLRALIAIAAAKDFKCATFDIGTAFLNSDIDSDIYMYVPTGFKAKAGYICKLQRSLYGLKQASFLWYKKFKEVLGKLGLKPLKKEPCIFKNVKNTLYLAIHIDDGILVGDSQQEIESLLENLKTYFEVKSNVNDKCKNFLGMQLNFENGIFLSQRKYVNSILGDYNMSDCKSVETPLVKGPSNYDVSKNKNTNVPNFPYREAVGSLIYLSTKTRPDISFAVNYESRFNENPTPENVLDVKRTLRYLKGTADLGIHYKKGGSVNNLEMYCDSDYAGDPLTGKSTTGYICYLNGAPISWCSAKQSVVALSSTEAEFIAACEAVKEIMFLRDVLEELLGEKANIVLKCDSSGAISIIKKGNFTKRTKHINVRYFFIAEQYQLKLFKVEHCKTSEQIADALTKPLCGIQFKKLSSRIVSLQN